jgi:radical SAM protein with 4Fe4S-binding SPASM domain
MKGHRMSERKPYYSDNRTVLADVVPLEIPFSLMIEPSQICNIKCNYCMQSFLKRDNKQMMSSKTFDVLCGQISDLGKIKKVNFAGWGEPLVNNDLLYMIWELKNDKLVENIDVVTNGLLLSRAISLNMVDNGADYIRISLQGMTSEKYQEVCGKKIDFEKLVDNIRFLYENKGDCRVFVKIADIALSDGEEELFYRTFENITDRMYIESIRPMFKENKQDGKIVSKFGFEHPDILVCPQPFFMMSITAGGYILPCCNYYSPVVLGNVHTTTLKEVWNSGGMKDLWKMLLSGERKTNKKYPACRECLMLNAIITPGDELDEKAEEIRKRL